jgi:hypothetical protein
VGERTDLLLLLFVSLAGLDGVLAGLGLGDGLLDGEVPAITLKRVLGLEGVLGAGDLEGEHLSAVLVEVGSVGLSRVSQDVSVARDVELRTKFRAPAGCSFWSACLTK